MLEIGDFYYYGYEPIRLPQVQTAAHIYKYIEQYGQDSQLRSRARLNLGLIY